MQAVAVPPFLGLRVKIVHWTILNNSGMHHVAASLALAETALGLESIVADPSKPLEWEATLDADIHVCHTHIPSAIRAKATKVFRCVWVGHGTPEHSYQLAWDAGQSGKYGHSDTWMTMQHWLKTADARVTFWPRHAAIYRTMLPKEAVVEVLPLGVETAFWKDGVSAGKFSGAPSVFTAENQHPIKWILDLLLAWPMVTAMLPEAVLHAPYLPHGHHRVLFPLANANGASYSAHLSALIFDRPTLRNAFQSVDFFCGLVRYGDHNRLCLEASAAGAKVISYTGNVYADYWVPEGDQRTMAAELYCILSGAREPRAKTPVPDIAETAAGMRTIYERVLA